MICTATMVLGESFKPATPAKSAVVPIAVEPEIIHTKPILNGYDSFVLKYTFSFLAASVAETSIYNQLIIFFIIFPLISFKYDYIIIISRYIRNRFLNL